MLRTDLLTLVALDGSQINQEGDKIGLRFKRSMLRDYSKDESLTCRANAKTGLFLYGRVITHY